MAVIVLQLTGLIHKTDYLAFRIHQGDADGIIGSVHDRDLQVNPGFAFRSLRCIHIVRMAFEGNCHFRMIVIGFWICPGNVKFPCFLGHLDITDSLILLQYYFSRSAFRTVLAYRRDLDGDIALDVIQILDIVNIIVGTAQVGAVAVPILHIYVISLYCVVIVQIPGDISLRGFKRFVNAQTGGNAGSRHRTV